jgi:hypothetical protein
VRKVAVAQRIGGSTSDTPPRAGSDTLGDAKDEALLCLGKDVVEVIRDDDEGLLHRIIDISFRHAASTLNVGDEGSVAAHELTQSHVLG